MEQKTISFPTPYNISLPQGDLDDFIFAVSEEPEISDR